MAEPIISVSGLRGIVGETLTPDVAARYVKAFASTLPPGDIFIGRDGRESGKMLSQAIQNALQSVGRNTIDGGVTATPTVGVQLMSCQAVGGIQITASHNPSPYNGIKLFSSKGRVIPAGSGKQVLERYRNPLPENTSYKNGAGSLCDDTISKHLSAVLKLTNVERIRQRRFRVVLDSNHGAGSPLGRRLLEELNCYVEILGERPNGEFAHTPEPTAENLTGVLKTVPAAKADIGFCQDPDADRLAIIDETGRYIGEEYTIALCIDHVLRHQKGPIVTNCSSSRMAEDLAVRYGVPFHRSAVGEANVVDAIIAHSAIFGGEGNGGPIDPRVVLVRDSFVGMALVLDSIAERETKISQMADDLPRYEIVKTKMSLPPEKIPPALNALKKHFADAKADRLDGLRLDWPNRWLLVRGSNTEPIVRAIAEAPTAAEASTLCKTAADVLAKI